VILFRLRPDSWKEIGDQFQMNTYSSMSSVIERVKVLLVKDRRLKDTVETLVLRLSKSQEQT
jgi:chromosomal replication initiation ATPase DnaA